MHQHLIVGLLGPTLTSEEKQWLSLMPPLGVILFARNIETPEQVSSLLADVRHCTGANSWAAIDEEGGRVNRIPWPPFSGRRHAAEFGRMFERNAGTAIQSVFQDSLMAGEALKELGFSHNCAPVLDVFSDSGHAIIGERAYSSDIGVASVLAMACRRGLEAAGVEAVGKHFPGHGRADADSHVAVPHVDASLEQLLSEAETFVDLVQDGLQHIMTAHVIYNQVRPDVATLSEFWLKDILRQRMGFSGCIWSDDLCMKGVGENVPDAAQASLQAGCDALLVCEPEGVRTMFETLQA